MREMNDCCEIYHWGEKIIYTLFGHPIIMDLGSVANDLVQFYQMNRGEICITGCLAGMGATITALVYYGHKFGPSISKDDPAQKSREAYREEEPY
jgi:hypothetical protein